MAEIAIPVVLTKASWDKQKGTIAKIFKKETGINAALDAVKDTHKDIQWALFEDLALIKADTVEKKAKVIKDCEDELKSGNVALCVKALESLEDKATKVGVDFKAHPLIPKSSAKHVKEVASEAYAFAEKLKTDLQARIEVHKKNKEKEEKRVAGLSKRLKEFVEARTAAAKVIAATHMKFEDWEKEATTLTKEAEKAADDANKATDKQQAKVHAATALKKADEVDKIIAASKVAYKSMDGDASVKDARLEPSDTELKKPIKEQTAAIWSTATKNTQAINAMARTLDTRAVTARGAAEDAAEAASETTKSVQDYAKMLLSAKKIAEDSKGKVSTPHLRTKGAPAEVTKALNALQSMGQDDPGREKQFQIADIRMQFVDKQLNEARGFIQKTQVATRPLKRIPGPMQTNTAIQPLLAAIKNATDEMDRMLKEMEEAADLATKEYEKVEALR